MPEDWVYRPSALVVFRQHWRMVQEWMELKANVQLNFEQSVFFLIAPWTFQEMALEATRPGGSVHGKVFNWMGSDPVVGPTNSPVQFHSVHPSGLPSQLFL